MRASLRSAGVAAATVLLTWTAPAAAAADPLPPDAPEAADTSDAADAATDPGADDAPGDDASTGEVPVEPVEPDQPGDDAAADGTTDEGAADEVTVDEPAPDLPYDEIIERTVVSVEAFWTDALPAIYGFDYEPVAALVPWDPDDASTLPVCGGSQPPPSSYAGNAFYCPPDDYIGWDDTGLFPRLYEDFGDATLALVLAHEWGHAIQSRIGIEPGTPTVLLELQADCFAGAWSRTAMPGDEALGTEPLVLPQSDVDEAISGYVLFRDPPGSDPLGPNAHGSAFDRIGAFRDGFVGGVEMCATFMTDGYNVAAVELIEADIESGGNVALDELFDALVPPDLEDYWTINAPAILGVEWDPTDEVRATDPVGVDADGGGADGGGADGGGADGGGGEAGAAEPGEPAPESDVGPVGTATCGGEAIDPERLALDVVYCEADDAVVWDRAGLVEPLYDAIGDFAVAIFLGNAWADKALALAGLEVDAIEATLRSDCLTGAWASDLWRRVRTSPELPPEEWTGLIGLSAGDLDEGVAGLLAVQDPEVARLDVTAFARVDAFRIGFFSPDPSECVAT